MLIDKALELPFSVFVKTVSAALELMLVVSIVLPFSWCIYIFVFSILIDFR